MHNQGRYQEYFRTGEVSWNKDTPLNISSTTHERKTPQGKTSKFFRLLLKKHLI